MLAVLAAIAFAIAAVLCFVPAAVSLTVIIGIIAIGLALLAIHTFRPWNL